MAALLLHDRSMKEIMEIIFISGMPCSGKSHLSKSLVKCFGQGQAERLPMDHYFLDAMCSDHRDQSHMSVYQRDRIDWPLLLAHIASLGDGEPIDTPRYDWKAMLRTSADSGIGRSAHLLPCDILFVDGMHPSLDPRHKHIFVCPSESIRHQLCQIRSGEMPVPEQYPHVLKQVEQSPYKESLAWLSSNAWQKVDDPISLDIEAFCRQCKWK